MNVTQVKLYCNYLTLVDLLLAVTPRARKSFEQAELALRSANKRQ